jgi:hypothetical protein
MLTGDEYEKHDSQSGRPPPLTEIHLVNFGGGLARTLRGWHANGAFVD